MITAYHYDHTHKSELNQEFVKGYRQISGNVSPNLFAVGAYDGMRLIYEALKKTAATRS